MNAYKLAWHLYRLGLSVIPLAQSKRPAVKWKKYQYHRCSHTNLDHWFGLQDFRPGIVCGQLSGLVVVDCDDLETAAMVAESRDCSPLRQRTRRGVHHVYRHPNNFAPRNSQRLYGLPLDVRGNGGYVVAYPDALRWTVGKIASAPEYVQPLLEETDSHNLCPPRKL